jgi:hypothetical protein
MNTLSKICGLLAGLFVAKALAGLTMLSSTLAYLFQNPSAGIMLSVVGPMVGVIISFTLAAAYLFGTPRLWLHWIALAALVASLALNVVGLASLLLQSNGATRVTAASLIIGLVSPALGISAGVVAISLTKNRPNKSLQPTATAVMPPAVAGDHASRSRG